MKYHQNTTETTRLQLKYHPLCSAGISTIKILFGLYILTVVNTPHNYMVNDWFVFLVSWLQALPLWREISMEVKVSLAM